jgi:8-oxo-dGTP diphosphatase
MSVGHFLGGIAALVWDPETSKYLLLRRSDSRDFGQGAWECVTGRVDQGESFTEALHREVQEEISAKVQIDFIISTTHFYRGQPQPENELLGVIYGCTLQDPAQVAIDYEHSELRWLTAQEAETFLSTGHWLRLAIQRAEVLREKLPEELSRFYRQNGFEI